MIGAKIRKLRLEKGISQTKFSKKIKIHQESLSRIERGKITPSLNTLEKVSNVLEIPIYMLFEKEDPNMSWADTGNKLNTR